MTGVPYHHHVVRMLIACGLAQGHMVQACLKDLLICMHHLVASLVHDDALVDTPPETFQIRRSHSLVIQHERKCRAEEAARKPCLPHATVPVEHQEREAGCGSVPSVNAA